MFKLSHSLCVEAMPLITIMKCVMGCQNIVTSSIPHNILGGWKKMCLSCPQMSRTKTLNILLSCICSRPKTVALSMTLQNLTCIVNGRAALVAKGPHHLAPANFPQLPELHQSYKYCAPGQYPTFITNSNTILFLGCLMLVTVAILCSYTTVYITSTQK